MASRTQVPRVENVEVCHASLAPGMGQYNHAVMIGYHEGVLLLAWKNGATTEDKNGQRILYAQSTDGKLDAHRRWTAERALPEHDHTRARRRALRRPAHRPQRPAVRWHGSGVAFCVGMGITAIFHFTKYGQQPTPPQQLESK